MQTNTFEYGVLMSTKLPNASLRHLFNEWWNFIKLIKFSILGLQLNDTKEPFPDFGLNFLEIMLFQ